MSNKRPDSSYNLCQFTFANGRMCGLPAHPKHDGLCLSHGRRRSPAPREDDLSGVLSTPAGDFIYQIDINHVLGKLFQALAANRVSPRRASTLAYIAHLLLQSQEGAKSEALRWELDTPTYKKMLELKYPPPGATTSKFLPRPVAEAFHFSQRTFLRAMHRNGCGQ